jgi:hypothetical protein
MINVEANIPYQEIYLFSREHGKVITDNTVVANEEIYMLFEGITGFNVENNRVFPGLKLLVKDNANTTIMEYADLFEDYTESGIPPLDLKELITAQLLFNDAIKQKTVLVDITVWDKKGSGQIRVTTNLKVK